MCEINYFEYALAKTWLNNYCYETGTVLVKFRCYVGSLLILKAEFRRIQLTTGSIRKIASVLMLVIVEPYQTHSYRRKEYIFIKR